MRLMNSWCAGLLVMGALGAGGVAVAAQPPAETKAPAKDSPQGQPAQAEPAKKDDSKPASVEDKIVQVKMTTSMGDIVIELNETKAPISTKNFLNYVDKGAYNGTIFHRVMETFMIQGGGFGPDMKQKPTDPPIKNEWQNGLKNAKYTVAMARTAVADSATSQFFINVVDNPGLDSARDGAAYAVFGRVISGTEVVDKIKTVKTGTKGGHQNVPLEPVTIVSVARVGDGK
ncbi:MAG: peptidylprolyl isomerase [Phycisphaerales bacterium]